MTGKLPFRSPLEAFAAYAPRPAHSPYRAPSPRREKGFSHKLSSLFCIARSCSFSSSMSFASALRLSFAGGFSEGRKHLHGLLEHFGVAADLLLDHLYRQLQVLAEWRFAEGAVNLLAHLHLLFGKGAHGMFEKARHDHLHLIAVIGDQLPEE